jgi:hypothetical protein
MHKNATKCNETLNKWCKNKHGASKIIDTFETYQSLSSDKSEGDKVVLRDFVDNNKAKSHAFEKQQRRSEQAVTEA